MRPFEVSLRTKQYRCENPKPTISHQMEVLVVINGIKPIPNQKCDQQGCWTPKGGVIMMIISLYKEKSKLCNPISLKNGCMWWFISKKIAS